MDLKKLESENDKASSRDRLGGTFLRRNGSGAILSDAPRHHHRALPGWRADRPGGAAIAPKLAAKLGQSFVVENVSGGGTNIAGQRVARSAPDGSMLFIHNLQISANVALYKSLPFDTEKDFLPIAMINSNPLVLVGRKTLEAKTLPELVAWMKKNPARIGHPGVGSTGHLATALLAQALGVEVTHIPYRGAAPMLQDTLGGHIDLFFATPQQVIGQFASGEVKVFGITSKDPSPQFPACRALCDLRPEACHRLLADHAGAGRHAEADRRCHRRRAAGGAGRPRNPQGLVAQRHGALSQAQRTPAGATAYLKSEIDRWGQVVRDNKIEAPAN